MNSFNQTDALTADRITITTSGTNAHALHGNDGTTLITVNALAGSVGADIGNSASDGISLVQVYGSVYADLTRQTRIGRAGSQGWSANLGARVRF